MFDVSFGELLIVGAVALVVLGPERLPKVARTAGVLVGRAQRFVAGIKGELKQQLATSELMELGAEIRAEGENLRQQVQSPIQAAIADLPALQTPESLGITPLQASPAATAALPPSVLEPVLPESSPAQAKPAAHELHSSELRSNVSQFNELQPDLFAQPDQEGSSAAPSSQRDRR